MTFNQSMLSVDKALSLILDTVEPNPPTETQLLDALQLTAASNVKSPISLPTWPNSAMDGYAVIANDIQSANPRAPVALNLVTTIPAGFPSDLEITKGSAAQISTGALIPKGADCVVPIELTSSNQVSQVIIKKSVPYNSNIRPAGEDVVAGTVLLKKQSVITPAVISLLAAVGLPTVSVFRKPKIGIASTGDELLNPDELLTPGKVYDSNAYALMALVKAIGAHPVWLGLARDSKRSVDLLMQKGIGLDLVLTSGGVSKGHLDFIKDSLIESGTLDFWSIKMRPGKPLVFGSISGLNSHKTPYIGLPGNPVSTLVAFEVLVRPAILKMMGRSNLERPTITAKLEDDIYNYDKRRVFARVSISLKGSIYHAKLTGSQGSNVISSFVNADGLAICPEDTPVLKKGSFAEVRMMNREPSG